jgi:hypothetical protein
MDENSYIRYQSLSLQEAKAMELEITQMIKYAYILGKVEGETKRNLVDNAIMTCGGTPVYLKDIEPASRSAH